MSTQWLWWAPFVAALAHIAEEFVYPGVRSTWDRGHRPQFGNAVTRRSHPIANAVFVALSARAALAGTGTLGGIPAEYNVAFWLLLVAMMFAHALLHVEESIRTQRVSPGLWTAVSLYVPLAVYGFWRFFSSGMTTASLAILAALAGVSFHLWPFLAHARPVTPCGLR
jgi:hypothetical protein